MGPDEVQYSVEGARATITINRPDRRNALSVDVIRELIRRLSDAVHDGAVRVIVLTGTGEKAFSAGADLTTAVQGAGPYALHEGRGQFADLLRKIHFLEKPVIARVNGAALGGGFGIALACDVTIAADTATFGTPEVDVGLFPMMIMPMIFRHTNHRKRALEMVLTGERLTSEKAHALGFLNRVVPAGELDAAVAEVANRIASKSPVVLRLGREAYRRMQDMPVDTAIEYLKCMLTVDTLTQDAAEGVTAFIEKRPPAWKGI